MKYLIAVVCFAAVALARPEPPLAPLAPVHLPFHYSSTGDVDGTYSFSYAAEDSSKTEQRQEDGTVIGGYQYIDQDGHPQKVQYKAGIGGVQILASNLPVGSTDPVVDTPEVLRATEEHLHFTKKMLQLIARAKVLNEEYERQLAAKKLAGIHH